MNANRPETKAAAEAGSAADRLGAIARQPAFHAFLFAVGVVLLVWPILGIPARYGMLALAGYLFAVWLALIALLFLTGRSLDRPDAADGDPDA